MIESQANTARPEWVPHLDQDSLQIEGLFVRRVLPKDGSRTRPPILFLHGAWHGAWAWEGWQTRFAGLGWRSHALSLRGHEGSRALSESEFFSLTVADYLQDIARVLIHIDEPTIVIGHSLGGILAQKIAESTPLAALVLVASGSPAEVGPLRDEDFPADRPVELDHGFARSHLFFDAEDSVIEAVLSRLVPEPPGVLNLTARGRVSVDKTKIHCPMLVVGAEHDRMVHPARRLADYYGCSLMMIAATGHDLMLERHGTEAADLISDWLMGCHL